MSHLENLIVEYYDWKQYLVKRNVKVGRLSHGGWEMELDVIAYHPHTNHLVHVEPSIDADSWAVREQRFSKKFDAGTKYIFSDIFTWLDPETPIERIAMLVSHTNNRDELCGAKIQSIDEFAAQLRVEISSCGKMSQNAIPEQYPMLRTVQLLTGGYYRVL